MIGVIPPMKTQISLEGLHTMMKRKVLWALLAAGMAVVSTGVASAQSTTALPTVGLLGVLTNKSLVGSWVETVTFDNGRPPLKSLVSFHADGTMMASDQGSVTLGPKPPPGASSSGVGAWTQLDWHTFAYTDKELFSDLSGNLTGFLKVSGVYTLSGSGDNYSGNSTFEVLGPDQKSLNPPITGTVSNSGERISVEVRHVQP
jgi:hypothetical protein